MDENPSRSVVRRLAVMRGEDPESVEREMAVAWPNAPRWSDLFGLDPDFPDFPDSAEPGEGALALLAAAAACRGWGPHVRLTRDDVERWLIGRAAEWPTHPWSGE